MGQLALEKLLKGLVIAKKNEVPPYNHNLVQLIKATGITITEEQKQDLIEITRFNVQARYDDIKDELYKKVTKSYTTVWSRKIEEFYLWLTKLY